MYLMHWFSFFAGKVLIIGGGIANFTNVASTFKGIVRALREYQQKLIHGNVSIFVRRAGPNFQEGLRIMRELGEILYFILPTHQYVKSDVIYLSGS